MKKDIVISVNGRSWGAKLNDTETAQIIAEELPFEGSPNFWGDEIYFEIPVEVSENERPEEDLQVGALAYWPRGNAFCIFYGPTPASTDESPRPASPVTVVGELNENVEGLKELDQAGVSSVKVERK